MNMSSQSFKALNSPAKNKERLSNQGNSEASGALKRPAWSTSAYLNMFLHMTGFLSKAETDCPFQQCIHVNWWPSLHEAAVCRQLRNPRGGTWG